MEIFLPAPTQSVRAVVVFVNRDLDRYMFDDRDWRSMCGRAACALLRLGLPNKDWVAADSQRVRNAGLGGDSALFTALRIAAERTAHPELQRAGIVFFGLSASGNFGLTFAGLHADRTIGLIRYHSHLQGLRVDTATLARIPTLTIVGADDRADIAQDSRTLWNVLRVRGAPAAYVSHLGQPHASIDGLVEAGRAMRSWTETVIHQRTVFESPALSKMEIERGWLLEDSAASVTKPVSLTAHAPRTSWLPDLATAYAVRQLKGMCAAIDVHDATALLGPGTHLESQDLSNCHYTQDNPRRDLWLSAGPAANEAAALTWLAQTQRAVPLSGLGAAANFFVNTRTSCSTLGVAKSAWTFYLSACGAGFGLASDSARLRPLSKQLIGES